MGLMGNVRRIISDDYDSEDRELVDRLGEILNRFMDETVGVVNGNLDFENLNQEIKVFSMAVDSSGTPVGNDKFRIGLSRAQGFTIISARNKVDSGVYPTSHPFISFTYNGQIIQVLNISGLQADTEYELTVQVIGV